MCFSFRILFRYVIHFLLSYICPLFNTSQTHVHFGFWSSYNRLRSSVHEIVTRELIASPGNLYITGRWWVLIYFTSHLFCHNECIFTLSRMSVTWVQWITNHPHCNAFLHWVAVVVVVVRLQFFLHLGLGPSFLNSYSHRRLNLNG